MIRSDVLIVGGGPAGLAAATRLRERGVSKVYVVDRETSLGGVPRHCAHLGFGVRDLLSLSTGPAYAAKRVAVARDAGAQLLSSTTALSFLGPTTVRSTGPAGVIDHQAGAVLLATGCRERPRAARLVAGTRPVGVLTTGALQRLVHDHHVGGFGDTVIVGAEHVSYSALLTLREADARVVAMVTTHEAHQTVGAVAWATERVLGVPLLRTTEVVAVRGRRRVEALEVRRKGQTAIETIACRTVVFTGDWIPDHELARRAHLEINRDTLGPSTDGWFRTPRVGVFAAGNALRGAETADRCALEGTAAADAIVRFLGAERGAADGWPTQAVAVRVDRPLAWIWPNRITDDGPPRPRFVLRSGKHLPAGVLEARQGTRLLWRRLTGKLVPNRAIDVRPPPLDALDRTLPIVVRYAPR